MKSRINFYLRDKNKITKPLITLFVRYKARTVKISTELKIHYKYWNEKKRTAKPTHIKGFYVNK